MLENVTVVIDNDDDDDDDDGANNNDDAKNDSKAPFVITHLSAKVPDRALSALPD